ncbi:hypothetical protein ACHSBP_20320 [Pseudoalteromonas sp. XMcav1-K]|uniref:hypothetical protein n=1 Tax=Pseudoalteromonas sp. XMcav1-K TaxID=3374372 RepID=UPI003756B7F4
MTEDVDAIELFYKALKELKDDPNEKINPNRVAQKAGRSNSNIYKKTSRHIQLQKDIKAAQEIRDKDLKIQKLEAEIRKLTRQLTNAKKKVEELQNKEPEVADNKVWIEKLTEMYRMSDNLITKNKSLQQQLIDINPDAVMEVEHVDRETGEIISFTRK